MCTAIGSILTSGVPTNALREIFIPPPPPPCPSYPFPPIHLDSGNKVRKENNTQNISSQKANSLDASVLSAPPVVLFNHLSCDSHSAVMTEVYIYVITSPCEKTAPLQCSFYTTVRFSRNAAQSCQSG
jgi:hypothetical protein